MANDSYFHIDDDKNQLEIFSQSSEREKQVSW